MKNLEELIKRTTTVLNKLTNWKYEKSMDDILKDVLEYWRTFVKEKLY